MLWVHSRGRWAPVFFSRFRRVIWTEYRSCKSDGLPVRMMRSNKNPNEATEATDG